MTTPRELQQYYEEGGNIAALLRRERGLQHNSREIIEVAYDLQTGSYTEAMADPTTARHKRDYAAAIAEIMLELGPPETMLEAGVGEATTLTGVLDALPHKPQSHGFDLSWSRAAYARRWLNGHGYPDTEVCTGDLTAIPFADNSMDVVFTSHAVEPNGGREREILGELLRVTRHYLILLEPGYERAGPAAQERMRSHGYCRGLEETARGLGGEVLRHELFPHAINPLNPTALTIVGKRGSHERPRRILACPRYLTPLFETAGALYSPEALVAYPILGGIPCLRRENGILAGKLDEIVGAGQVDPPPRLQVTR